MVEPADPSRHTTDRPRPRPRPAATPTPAAEPEAAPKIDTAAAPVTDRAPRVARTRRRLRAVLVGGSVLFVALVVALVLVVTIGSDDSTDAPAAASADDASAVVSHGDEATAFLAGATSDIAAVTTYDYRSLDSALSNGEAVTTGAYQSSFRTALTGPLATEARRVHRVQTFILRNAGIGAIASDGTSAKVLIFGVQSVTDDTTKGAPRLTLLTLTASVQRQASRYLLAGLSAGTNAGLPAGTSGLRAAAEAGRGEVAAVLTLRHDHAVTDDDAAIAGAVDPLRASLTRRSAATRSQVTRGHYDLAGTVTAVAVQQATGNTLVLLVAATGTKTVGDRSSVVVDGRYVVTVVRAGSSWATSSIAAVRAT